MYVNDLRRGGWHTTRVWSHSNGDSLGGTTSCGVRFGGGAVVVDDLPSDAELCNRCEEQSSSLNEAMGKGLAQALREIGVATLPVTIIEAAAGVVAPYVDAREGLAKVQPESVRVSLEKLLDVWLEEDDKRQARRGATEPTAE